MFKKFELEFKHLFFFHPQIKFFSPSRASLFTNNVHFADNLFADDVHQYLLMTCIAYSPSTIMNLEQASDLERLIEVSQTWPITDVPFEVCMDPLLDETTTVNLAHHIGPDTNDETAIKEHLNAFKVDPRRHDPMAYTKMYLPPQYNTNDKTT
jgi:hypothetical protein